MQLFRKKTTEQPPAPSAEETSQQQQESIQTTPTTQDSESTDPLITTPEDTPTSKRRTSSFLGKLKRSSARKPSISDSGPYIFAFDTRLGRTVLQRNPHWPNEDSWKRENDTQRSCIGSMGYN
ncbi:hypothetical protein LTR85_003809 [Meristemomyces frigidus]|nr:hypothetical protein LTR85_003809 [Meristemomyces frigidus]